jgi:Domain of unknown function (DUF4395)
VPDLDARVLRLQQGVVTVLLLAGFVFGILWMIPIAAVLPGLDAALVGAGPTARLWRALLADRVSPARSSDTPAAFRTQSLAVFSALVIATLVFLAGLDWLATILSILVAVLAAACATGLFNLGAELDRRRR